MSKDSNGENLNSNSNIIAVINVVFFLWNDIHIIITTFNFYRCLLTPIKSSNFYCGVFFFKIGVSALFIHVYLVIFNDYAMYHYISINLPRIFCCFKLIYYFVSIKSRIFFWGGGLVVILSKLGFMNYWSCIVLIL